MLWQGLLVLLGSEVTWFPGAGSSLRDGAPCLAAGSRELRELIVERLATPGPDRLTARRAVVHSHVACRGSCSYVVGAVNGAPRSCAMPRLGQSLRDYQCHSSKLIGIPGLGSG